MLPQSEQSSMTMPIEQAAINLAVALGLSAVIGFERQWRNRLAGRPRPDLGAGGNGASPGRQTIVVGWMPAT